MTTINLPICTINYDRSNFGAIVTSDGLDVDLAEHALPSGRLMGTPNMPADSWTICEWYAPGYVHGIGVACTVYWMHADDGRDADAYDWSDVECIQIHDDEVLS